MAMCRNKQKSAKDTFSPILRWIGNAIDIAIFWVRKLWYVILLGLSTPYVICNFEEIVDFQFFEEFDGKNLIFLVWIVLLIIPLFDSFEGFGISIKRFNQRRENEQLDELVKNKELPTQEELERKLNDERK